MRENKFRVWCEFEFEGEIIKKMEGPESWFLMSQTGKMWSYEPLGVGQPIDKAYKKAIPLFYSGFTDKDEKEIYEKDILQGFQGRKGIVEFENGTFWVKYFNEEMKAIADFARVPYIKESLGTLMSGIDGKYVRNIGNIYENPELMAAKKTSQGK